MCKPKAPAPVPQSSMPEFEFPEPEYPGPSESELALADIATEKYGNWKKHYDPVEKDFLAEQDHDKSAYGKMVGYADAQQVAGAQTPAQVNVASGSGMLGLGAMSSAATGGQAAASAVADASDFQRRNANKLWGLSTANKLQAANQSTLTGVAGAASSAAIQTAQAAQGTANRLQAQSLQNQHQMEMQKYNYNQGRIQNLAQMGASLWGWHQGNLGGQPTGGSAPLVGTGTAGSSPGGYSSFSWYGTGGGPRKFF